MNSAGNTAFSAKLGDNRGFTMIEMAIVLVIIGIIMGAIMKGQDLIKGAQGKEIANAFVGKWHSMAGSYYDKTGRFLADGTTNGGTSTTPTGKADIVFAGDLAAAGGGGKIYAALKRAGIDPCANVKTNATDATNSLCTDKKHFGKYTVDSQSGPVDMTVGFGNYSGAATSRKSMLVMVNAPVETAIAMDKIYDGIADGRAGAVLNLGCDDTLATAAPAATANPGSADWDGTKKYCDVGIIVIP